MQQLQSEIDKIKQEFDQKNLDKRESFEFYTNLDLTQVPPEWKPSQRITQLAPQFHKGREINDTPTLTEQGYPMHSILKDLLRFKYPQYAYIIQKYCRPLGTTYATFKDYNREQNTKTCNPLHWSKEVYAHPLCRYPIHQDALKHWNWPPQSAFF